MIKDHLQRDWIDIKRDKGKKDFEDLVLIREYVITETDRRTGRNALTMEVSVLIKIRNRNNGETFRRLWQDEDNNWRYTTESPQKLSLQRFLEDQFCRYMDGEELKLSPDMQELFETAREAGYHPSNIMELL